MINNLLNNCSTVMETYLYLDEYGETDFLNVCSDGEWITIGYCNVDNDEAYSSFNKDFADSKEMTDLNVGGQSPVEKRNAIQDFELAKKIVEYFIYTGKMYPNIDWMQWH